MRLIDADKLKECFSEPTFKNEMVKIIIDRQPSEQVFTRKQLEGWLYEIALNNTENDFGKYVEEIINRLNGFERYVEDMGVQE